MNELNLHTLERYQVEPVETLVQSAYLYGCTIAKQHKIKWHNSVRTLKKHTKNNIHKPVYFRIVLQHKQGKYYSLHLYKRVEHGFESLVGKTVIQESATVLKTTVTDLDFSMVQRCEINTVGNHTYRCDRSRPS